MTRTFAYLWLLIGMLALLVTASFAWFSVSNTPKVGDMALYVNASQGLLIAERYDAPEEEWGYNITFPELITTTSPLKPVSWSEADQCFKSVRYGFDGRQSNRWKPLTDAANANATGDDQYYVYSTFFAKTDTACVVSLADAMERGDGQAGAGTYVIGTPRWNELTHMHEDGGNGAQRAIRIGFRVTHLDAKTGSPTDASTFYIYEPNCDSHNDGYDAYLETNSTDGTATLVPAERLLRQTTSGWRETDPVQRNSTIKSLGSFTSDTDMFHLDAGEIIQIVMYIWIEGQDLDCYGFSDVSQLSANIQFEADYSEQSGLEEIPDYFERVNTTNTTR